MGSLIDPLKEPLWFPCSLTRTLNPINPVNPLNRLNPVNPTNPISPTNLKPYGNLN